MRMRRRCWCCILILALVTIMAANGEHNNNVYNNNENEPNGFMSNLNDYDYESERVCNSSNKYCIFSKSKDQCESTIIYPQTCLSQLSEYQCEFFLEWHINPQSGNINFSLTRYNYLSNKWIALIFSRSNSDEHMSESDIVITLFPSNNQAKIIDGVIKGKDVLLNEYIDDLSEKKIFDESLIIRRNYADIKFSRRLDYGHDTDEELGGVSFNNCDSAASDGFYMFYIHGNLDADNNILFNTSNTTVTMGPFCFKSCSQLDGAVVLEKQQQVGKKFLTDHQTPLRMSSLQSTQSVRSDEFPAHSQNLNFIIKNSDLSNSSSPTLPSVTSTSSTIGSSTSTISTAIITADSTTQTSTSTLVTMTSTSTTSASTVSGNIVTYTSTMSSSSLTTGSITSISSTIVQSSTGITTQNTTLTSVQSNNVSSSPSARVSSDASTQPTQLTSVSTVPTTNSTQPTSGSTMSQTTNRTSTTQTDTSTSVTTTSSTTTTSTTTNPANVCVFFSKPFNSNDLSVSFDSLTNKTTVKTSLPSLSPNLIIGVFITDVGANELNLMSVNFSSKQIFNNINLPNVQTSVLYDTNTIVIQLPIGGKLNNGVSLTDCFQIKLYTSNKTNTILLNANDYSSLLTSSGPESVCFGCSIAPKRPVTTFASFVYKNLPWTDDYNNLSSVKSLELANRISDLIKSAFKSQSKYYYELQSFVLQSIKQKSSRKRSVSKDNTPQDVSVNAKFDTLSSNSDKVTLQNLNTILKQLPDANLQLVGVSSTDSSNASNQSESVSDYQRRFAIALVLSLLATIIVLGGALIAFERWKHKRYGDDNDYNNANQSGGIRLAVPNRRGVRYENSIQMENYNRANNITSNDFEYNFNNPTFNDHDEFSPNGQNHHHQHNNTNGTYTDFTGSREVGIDVEPISEFISYTKHSPNKPINTNQNPHVNPNYTSNVSNLSSIIKETKSIESNLSTGKAAPNDNDNDDDDMNFSYFDTYKNNMNNEKPKPTVDAKKAAAQVAPPKLIVPDSEPDDEEEQVTESVKNEEDDREINDIFSKDIEESLPELFGSYKSSSNLNKEFTSSSQVTAPPVPPLPAHIEAKAKQQMEYRSKAALGFTSNDHVKLGNLKSENSSSIVTAQRSPSVSSTKSTASSYSTSSDTSSTSSASYSIKKTPKPNPTESKKRRHRKKKTYSIDQQQQQHEQQNGKSFTGVNMKIGSTDDENDRDEDEFKSIDKNMFKAHKQEQSIVPEVSLKSIRATDSTIKMDDGIQQTTKAAPFFINSQPNDADFNSIFKNETDYFFNNGIAEYATPRVCQLVKNPMYNGLGIHLCDTKNHMIKDIEPDSPAEQGGLKPGDKILYINNENVENMSYLEVIECLKRAVDIDNINLIVMNAIEYNIFKGKSNLANENKSETFTMQPGDFDAFTNNTYSEFAQPQHQQIQNKLDEENLKKFDFLFDDTFNNNNNKLSNEDSTINLDVKDTFNPGSGIGGGGEFNPFDDITNEIFTPFLHYSTIPPPPDTFKEDQFDSKSPQHQQEQQPRNNNDLFDSIISTQSTGNLNLNSNNNNKNNMTNSFDVNFQDSIGQNRVIRPATRVTNDYDDTSSTESNSDSLSGTVEANVKPAKPASSQNQNQQRLNELFFD